MSIDFLFGSNSIIDAFIGDKSVTAIYLGETLVWPLTSPSNADYLLNEENKALITEDDLYYINIDKA